MINNQINRHEGLNFFRGSSTSHRSVAHSCNIDKKGHSGKILENNSSDGKRDLVFTRRFRIPIGEILDIDIVYFSSIDISQNRLEDDSNTDRQAIQIRSYSRFSQRWERINFTFGSGAGGKGTNDVKTHNLWSVGGASKPVG
jgi:hypothetical protein